MWNKGLLPKNYRLKKIADIFKGWGKVTFVLFVILFSLSFLISSKGDDIKLTKTFVASSQTINSIEEGKDRTKEEGIVSIFNREVEVDPPPDNNTSTNTTNTSSSSNTTESNTTSPPTNNYDEIGKNGFYMHIEKIGLFKPAVKDVDPRYKEEYQKSWETGISHGKFTAYPNEVGNAYFFAHSINNASLIDQYNAWFTRIDELAVNDVIIVYYEGYKYSYKVSNIFTVDPTATGIYTGVSPVPKITLQTCGPPRGNADSRYIVEALRFDEQQL